MADPLSQLRQFWISGKKIDENGDFIIFGEHGWPKKVNTNYQVYSTDEDKTRKEYYTLECLLYFLKHKDLVHHHYIKQAGFDNKPAVHRPDRKHLLAYLTGESQTAPGIDKNAPIPSLRVPVSTIKSQGSSGHDASRSDGQSSSAKKSISQAREELAAKLEKPATKKIALESVPNDSSAAITKLGAEKVAAMRAKHMAVKRTQIVDADSEPGTVATETDNTSLHALDSDQIKLIKSKEKIWRTRSAILQSQKKDFGKPILAMLNLLAPEKAPSRKPITTVDSRTIPSPNVLNQQQQQQQTSYNRYDQEKFVRLDIGVAIDTKKSFVGGVSNALASVAQPTPKPTMPRPYGDTVDSRRPQSKKPRSMVPIIIIPATTTSIINIYNAKTIFEDLTYVEGKAGNRDRENDILIQRRKPDGTCAHFKVIDNALKLEEGDWLRVVAVFVQGQAWQFKGWPWNGSPVDIFSNIKGFHLKWSEAKLDENVAKWNVEVLELSRNKPHMDKPNLMRFWASLDTYLVKYKSGKLKF